MEKHLRPHKFDEDPNAPDACRKWKLWKKQFTNYLAKLIARGQQPINQGVRYALVSEKDKLDILINHIDYVAFEYMSQAKTYEEAIELLDVAYTKNCKRFARYLLLATKQQPGESLEDFLHKLQLLSADCEFESLTAKHHKEQTITDAFLAGLQSNYIRQMLLEGKDEPLQNLLHAAKALEKAQTTTEMYDFDRKGQQSYIKTEEGNICTSANSLSTSVHSTTAQAKRRYKCADIAVRRSSRPKAIIIQDDYEYY